MARLAEEDNQPALARAFYEKLSERYLNYYYAELGRQRLRKLPAAPAEHYALLDRVPPLDSSGKVEASDPPAEDLHLQKAELLGNGGLVDFAVRELQAERRQKLNVDKLRPWDLAVDPLNQPPLQPFAQVPQALPFTLHLLLAARQVPPERLQRLPFLGAALLVTGPLMLQGGTLCFRVIGCTTEG